jgi:long-chain acyl-CoA synthetase
VILSASSPEETLFNEYYQKNSEHGSLPYVGRLLQRAAKRYPQATALIGDEGSCTYLALYQQAVAVSQQLLDRGIKPRDRVFLFMPNSHAYYVAYFAILQVGAVVTPLNIFLREYEFAHIMRDATPSYIICSTTLLDIVHNANSGVPLPPIMTEQDIVTNSSIDGFPVFEPFCLDPHEMAALLYTSGTTGLPKGVMLSSNNIMTNILQGISLFHVSDKDRVLAVLPLFHSFAQNTYIWAPFFVGACVIIVSKIERRYISKALDYKPTIIAAVPAFYGLLCLLKTAPVESCRIFISGGDALPDKIRAGFALLYRRKICSGYGLTETSPYVAGCLDDEAVPANTVGRPVPQMQCSFRDDNGNEVVQGTIGQLWLKGPNIMLGYYNAPQATADVLIDGWLSTGDLAYADTKGRIVISGRYKDLIINKGLKIYPQEIENVLTTHPLVIRAAVIGVADEASGQVAVAYVQLKEEDPTIEQELKQLCERMLAAYKVPRSFICSTENLPTTATGKVDKKVLQKRHE